MTTTLGSNGGTSATTSLLSTTLAATLASLRSRSHEDEKKHKEGPATDGHQVLPEATPEGSSLDPAKL